MIKEIKTIRKASGEYIDTEINLLIAEGWQPYGNLFICSLGLYVQQLVKYKKN